MSITLPDALQKKRRLAEERWRRLCCHKNRTIGIDRDALDAQVAEKQEFQRENNERDNYYSQQALLMDRHAVALQAEADNLRREQVRALEEYRNTFQKKESRREWDLNDPDRKKKGLPARVCDDDPRLGPSSIQKFEGEDIASQERRKAQQAQQARWCNEQIDEKLIKKWKERDADRTFDDRREEMAYRTWQIEQQVALQRQQATKNTAEFNKSLAEQKSKERELNRIRETQKNLEEIENMLNSDFLNEVEGTVSTMGEKVKRERFKGLSQDQREALLKEQALQREAQAQRRAEEAESDRQLAMFESMQTRMATILDRQRARERRDTAKAVAAEQRVQATEAKERKRSLNELYANAIGEEFFKPFGECIC